MSLGAVIRRAREQRRLSQRQLAIEANVSSSFVTRLERDLANPSWQTIQKLAAALCSTARLMLVPDQDAVGSAAALVAQAKPVDRLRAQPINIVAALSWLNQFGVPYVVAGAVAALVQGFPTPAQDLRILVDDVDDGLMALQEVLIANELLFDEFELDEFRGVVERVWLFGDCEVRVTLVAGLPTFLTVELLEEFDIRVLPPDALVLDEEVAATLQISRMGSSDS